MVSTEMIQKRISHVRRRAVRRQNVQRNLSAKSLKNLVAAMNKEAASAAPAFALAA